jgi:tripartite-type tricarboxylate transporter receptor subunit TctC
MKVARRQFLHLATGSVALRLPCSAWAQSYPSRPVRIIVAVATAGATDITARLIGQWLSERLGQSFVIENRPGGNSNIGTETVIRALGDGYSLLLANSVNAINASLYQRLSYNFLRDIAPVAGISETPLVMLVHPQFPAKSVPEFLAHAKANPGRLNLGSAGAGTPVHMAGELFKMATGVKLEPVQYRGEGPALADLLGGQVDFVFATPAAIYSGWQLRALAVTSASRAPVLPEVPAITDYVAGVEASFWTGLCAPKNTPAEVIIRLNAAVNAGLADPTLKARFADLGAIVFPGSPAEFSRFIADDTEKWAKVVKFAGIKAD